MPKINRVEDIGAFGDRAPLAADLLDRVKGMDDEGVYEQILKSGVRDLDPEPFENLERRYKIGGKIFVMSEPVLAQQDQMTALLAGTEINVGDISIDLGDLERTAMNLLAKIPINQVLVILGKKAPRFFAIVLTPEGEAVNDKNMDDVERHLRGSMKVTSQLLVVKDFLALLRALAASAETQMGRQ